MKEKSMKRLLSFVMAFLMIFSVLAPSVQTVMASELDNESEVQDAALASVVLDSMENGYLSFESSDDTKQIDFPIGENIVINVNPDEGYKADTVSFTTSSGNTHEVSVTDGKAIVPIIGGTKISTKFEKGSPLNAPVDVKDFTEVEKQEYENTYEENKEKANESIVKEEDKILDDSDWQSADDSREIAYILANADRKLIGEGNKLLSIDYVSVANTLINLNKTKARTLDDFWMDRDEDGYTEDVSALENQYETAVSLYGTSSRSDYVVAKPTIPNKDEFDLLEYQVGDSNMRGINLKDDVIYDEQTGLLYVKKSAILPVEEEDGEKYRRVGRVRFQSLSGTREIANEIKTEIIVNVKSSGVNGDIPSLGKAEVKTLDSSVNIKLARDEQAKNAINNYTIDEVRVNGIVELSENIIYDDEKGILTIDRNPASIQTVDIKISNNIAKSIKKGVDNILGTQNAYAQPRQEFIIGTAYKVNQVPKVGELFTLRSRNTYLKVEQHKQLVGHLCATLGHHKKEQAQVLGMLNGTLRPDESQFEGLESTAYNYWRFAYTESDEYTGSKGTKINIHAGFDLQLACSHVNVDAQFHSGGHFNDQHKEDNYGIRMSVLAVGTEKIHLPGQSKSYGYIICGFVNPTHYTQSGFGMAALLYYLEEEESKDEGGIILNKVDSEGTPVEGAVFGIYNSRQDAENNRAAVKTMTTDYRGDAASGDMPPGMYYVKEISAPGDLIKDDEIFDVQVYGGYKVTQIKPGGSVINKGKTEEPRPPEPPEPEPGSISLHKVDLDTGYDLPGAVFSISGPSGRFTVETDRYGEAYLDNLEAGEYFVREISAPDKYNINPEYERGVDVTVYEGENTEVGGRYGITNEKQKGWISVSKIVNLPGGTKKGLDGIVFDVYGPGGRTTLVTDSSGRAISEDLEVGEYTVTERPTQRHNVIVDGRSYNVTVEDKQTTEVNYGQDIENDYPLASVRFDKKEIRNQDVSPFTNENYFKNAKFRLKINSIDTLMTGLPQYRGYLRDTSGNIIEDDYSDNQITFSDLPMGSYSVVEVDTGNPNIPVNTSTLDFSVVRGPSQGTVRVEYGPNGSASNATSLVNRGKKEDLNPDKYGNGRTHNYSVPSSKTTFYNFLKLGDIRLAKREKQQATNNSLLRDVEFTLEGITNPQFKKIIRYTGQSNGELEIKEIPHGKYRLYESKVPAGYKPNNWEKIITVEPGKTEFNYIGNDTIYNDDIRVDFEIEKKDLEGIETDISIFDGIKFRVEKIDMVKDPHTITPEKFDKVFEIKDGKFKVENVPLGRYKITEIGMPDKASRRYFTNNKAVIVVDARDENNIKIESNNSIELAKKDVDERYKNLNYGEEAKTSIKTADMVFANGARYGVLKVHKKYPKTDQSLKGAVFRIHGGPNNYYDKQYTTGEDGTFMTEPLRISPLDGSGNYYIEEIQPPDGFVFAKDTLGPQGEIMIKEELEEYDILLDENKTYKEVVPGHKQYKFVNNERVYSPPFKVNKPSITGDYIGEAKFVGAEFDLYCRKIDYPGIIGEKQPGELIGHYVTDENGQFNIDPLPSGSYELIETKAPEGFLLNPNPITIEIKRTSYTNPVGEIIVHQRENYQGLEDELNAMRQHLTEIKNGLLDGEENRTYEQSELGLETKHTPNNTQEQVEFMELVKMGRITIDKHYDDTPEIHFNDKELVPEEGIEFSIYPFNEDGSQSETPIDVIYINKDGKAVSKYLPYGKYILKQTNKTDKRVDLVDDEIFEIRDNKDVFRYDLINEPTRMRLRIVKWDKDTKQVIFQKGVMFELYAAEDIDIPYSGGKLRYKKDEKVEFQVGTRFTTELITYDEGYTDTFQKLYAGNYYLKEVKGPTGYFVDEDAKFFVTIPTEEELAAGKVNTIEVTLRPGEKAETLVKEDIENQAQYGELTINKVAEQFTGWTTENRTVKYQEPETIEKSTKEIPKANFAMTLTSVTMKDFEEQTPTQGLVDKPEYYVTTENSIRDTSDENSEPVKTTGTEIMTEEDFKSNTELAAKVDAAIAEGQSLETGVILVDKKVDDKGFETVTTITVKTKMIKVPGGKTSYETKIVQKPVTNWETVYTDENGKFSREVGPGKYTLSSAGETIATLEVAEGETKTFEYKFDPEIEDVETYVPGEITSKDYTVNRPVYETLPLKDARFELIATEDINSYDNQTHFYKAGEKMLFASEDIYKDGNLVYKKGDAISAPILDSSLLDGKTIDYIKTGEEKDTIATRIPLGHYKLVEVEAPLGYKRDLTENVIELDPAHQSVLIVKAEPLRIEDYRQILTINANKVLQERRFPEGQTPDNTVFGLFTKEEINGLPADSMLDVANPDVGGYLEFKDVPPSKFYIKELSTVNGYILNEDEYEIKTAFTKDLDEDLEFQKEGTIENKPSEYTATVVKVDTVTNEALPGVKFKLWKIYSDGQRELVRNSEDEDYWITDENGSITADGLDEGNYEWEEVEVKPGYVEENKKVQIAVNEDSNLEVTIGNSPTEMSFVKIDAETGAFVAGAHLALENEDGTPVYVNDKNYVELDEKKQVQSANWTTTEEPYVVRGLEVGKTYRVVETQAPDGYATAQPVVFTVDNVKGIHVSSVNDKYTDVRIIKKDWSSGEHVEDATLEIREVNPDGSLGDIVVDRVTGREAKWTTGKGIEDGYIVRGLRVGVEHAIVETVIPEGYLPPVKTVTYVVLDTEDAQSLVVLNEPIPVVGTSAAYLDGTKENLPEENLVVVDVVHMEKLVVGQTYKIDGQMVNVKDPTQVFAESTAAFVAKDTIQDVEVKFIIKAKDLEGTSIVAFEELYRYGRPFEDGPIAEHKVPEDKDQTVYIPKIGTTATDKIDGAHDALATDKVTIVDVVKYENLEPNKEHRAEGKLMDKKTNRPLLINGKEVVSETVFTSSETGNGEVEVIFEIDASALAGTSIVVFEKVYNGVEPDSKVVGKHEDIEDKEQTVNIPKIGTTAKDSDGTKEVAPASKEVTVIDTVTYENLIPEGSYTMKGILMDKSTNKPLLVDGKEVTSEKKFIAKEKDGSIELEFKFSPKGLDGKDLVVFETLFNSNAKPVGKHEKIDDEGQTVHVPSLGTEADYFGAEPEDLNNMMTITDVAGYTNLLVGKEYTMNGVLMDKETGKALIVDGKEVRNSIKFVPKETNGFVKIEYKVPVSAIAGKSIVVFEDLVRDGKLVVTHYDIEDEDQTVDIPKIGTKAELVGAEKDDANRMITVKDVIEYKNLKVGKEYTMKGILMDKETNTPLLIADSQVKSEKTFIPENPDGFVEVEFVIPMDAVKGKTLVVFEDAIQDEKVVAIHHDIEDKPQTVEVPEIATTATFDDNNKEANPKENLVIIDKVKYTNLVVGEEYTVNGILMDKDTDEPFTSNGKEIESTITFTPDTADGFVELRFEVPGKDIAGKTLVAFETLEKDERTIAIHHDINDEEQTVKVTTPEIGTTANVSGEKEADADGYITITDRVEYKDLVVGKTYIVRGILMDKSTEQPFAVAGETVEAYAEFTAVERNGYVDVDFEFDASDLGDTDLVVFERLYEVTTDKNNDRKEEFITSHEDINDESQSVRLNEVPEEEEEITDVEVKHEIKVGDESGSASKGIVPIIILVVVIAGAAVYFFVIKKKDTKIRRK